MSNRVTTPDFHSLLISALFAVIFLMTAPVTNAQKATSTRNPKPRAANTRATTDASLKADAAIPLFSEYKGTRLGMSADEVRTKLSDLKEKGDDQDFFVFSETESAQIFYQSGKVYAISINYTGASGAPKCADVIGEEVQAKADGSMHHLVRYPEAGYWVSYSRTAGEAPLTTITMQKMP